jgi:SAM-dependent methyltransferase
MGCGPGQIARYLRSRGAEACGIDLSPGMIEQARRLNPEIPFQQGDMLDLNDVADGVLGGIAAFYSIIHLPPQRVVEALCEFRRVLAPGGVALIAFHIGEETIHADEMWGYQVNLDAYFFTRPQMKDYLAAAGFTLQEAIERDPYPPEIEYRAARLPVRSKPADHRSKRL